MLSILSDPKSPMYGVNLLAYNSSKSALNGLTLAFAKELAGERVSVNSVCPGLVKTDLGNGRRPTHGRTGCGHRREVGDDGRPADRQVPQRRGRDSLVGTGRDSRTRYPGGPWRKRQSRSASSAPGIWGPAWARLGPRRATKFLFSYLSPRFAASSE